MPLMQRKNGVKRQRASKYKKAAYILANTKERQVCSLKTRKCSRGTHNLGSVGCGKGGVSKFRKK
jgi:hypothetical protein